MNLIKKVKKRLGFRRELMNVEDNIFIYQMGKVGSTSLEKSIAKGIHWHNFYPSYIEKIYKSKFHKEKFLNKLLYPVEFYILRKVIRYKIKKGKEVNIITLVREPISRNISFLFQFAPLLLYKYYHEGHKRDDKYNTLKFLETEFYNNLWHNSAEGWFELELKKITGINVFDYSFDKEAGFSIIRKDNINLLILQMEKMSQNQSVIGEFIGDESFELTNDNLGSKKWYYDLYKEFKDYFKPSREYVEELYNSQYMKHFYSNKERSYLKEKWLNK